MNNVQIRHSGLLMFTAMIWGAAFVAQSMGMDYVGPCTFLFSRSVIGTLALIPVVLITGRIQSRREEKGDLTDAELHENVSRRSFLNPLMIRGGLFCGFFLFAASIFQQFGIQYTTAGKAGFITAFYIIIVPVISMFFGRRHGLAVWISVIMGVIGLYFLCITESFSIGRGDLMVLMCAFLFSIQILVVDHYSPQVDGVRLSMLEFFFESVFAGILMLMLETPRMSDIIAAAGPILYAGLLSNGVGYTLQIIGQRDLNPAVASLIMCLESVFSVIFGFIILRQGMSARELLGSVIMFAAILVAQMPMLGIGTEKTEAEQTE